MSEAVVTAGLLWLRSLYVRCSGDIIYLISYALLFYQHMKRLSSKATANNMD